MIEFSACGADIRRSLARQRLAVGAVGKLYHLIESRAATNESYDDLFSSALGLTPPHVRFSHPLSSTWNGTVDYTQGRRVQGSAWRIVEEPILAIVGRREALLVRVGKSLPRSTQLERRGTARPNLLKVGKWLVTQRGVKVFVVAAAEVELARGELAEYRSGGGSRQIPIRWYRSTTATTQRTHDAMSRRVRRLIRSGVVASNRPNKPLRQTSSTPTTVQHRQT
jgi:hypothetical protein